MQYITQEKGYYLPLGYNDNKIVLLVRDPQWLFAYWEITNDKREQFITEFGQDSWNSSKPVIKLVNATTKSVKCIEIDDFARNWYIEIEHTNCTYTAEIGRMFIDNSFVSLAVSNIANTPNNKPAIDKPIVFANYKNIKTTEIKKTIKNSTSTSTITITTSSTPTTFQDPNIKIDLGKYEHKFNNTLGLSSAALSGVSSDSFIK